MSDMRDGHVPAADGLRLYFQQIGRGPRLLVVPNGVPFLDRLTGGGAPPPIVADDPRTRGGAGGGHGAAQAPPRKRRSTTRPTTSMPSGATSVRSRSTCSATRIWAWSRFCTHSGI